MDYALKIHRYLGVDIRRKLINYGYDEYNSRNIVDEDIKSIIMNDDLETLKLLINRHLDINKKINYSNDYKKHYYSMPFVRGNQILQNIYSIMALIKTLKMMKEKILRILILNVIVTIQDTIETIESITIIIEQ